MTFAMQPTQDVNELVTSFDQCERMSVPLFRLLGMGYGLAAAIATALLWAGAAIWIALLTVWIGGAIAVLAVGVLLTSRRDDPAPMVNQLSALHRPDRAPGNAAVNSGL